MTITATQKYTRQATRKVRLVANTVRKMPLEQALRQLAVIERRSTLVIMKTVKQAVANAINNHGLKFTDLKLENIIVNEGPRYQRMRAVSRGRGHEIKKRTSHITVTLSTLEPTAAKPVTPAASAAVTEKTQPVAVAAKPAKPAAQKKTKSSTSATKKVTK